MCIKLPKIYKLGRYSAQKIAPSDRHEFDMGGGDIPHQLGFLENKF
jgi:hypothetical protein